MFNPSQRVEQPLATSKLELVYAMTVKAHSTLCMLSGGLIPAKTEVLLSRPFVVRHQQLGLCVCGGCVSKAHQHASIVVRNIISIIQRVVRRLLTAAKSEPTAVSELTN